MRWLILSSLFLLAACNGKSSPPLPPPVAPPPSPEWQVLYSPGAAPLTRDGNGWCIVFVNPVDYIVLGYQGSASEKVLGDFEINGTDFYATEGQSGPAARFYFQRRGDNMSGQGEYEFYRWWSNPAHISLRTSQRTFVVPFDPQNWSSVFGKAGDQAPIQFKGALANLQSVGVTFGGDFFGHGVGSHSKSGRVCLRNFAVR